MNFFARWKNIPQKQNAFRFIFHFALKQWFLFSLLLVVCLACSVFDTIFPIFLDRIIDNLISFHFENINVAFRNIFILIISFWILKEIFSNAQNIICIYVFPQFRANILKKVFSDIKSNSQQYFHTNRIGTITKKLTILPESCQVITETLLLRFVSPGIGIIVLLVMMGSISPILSLMTFSWICLHSILNLFFLKKSNTLSTTQSDAAATLSGKMIDVFLNISSVFFSLVLNMKISISQIFKNRRSLNRSDQCGTEKECIFTSA